MHLIALSRLTSTAPETIAMKKKTMKSRKLHHMEFFGPPPPSEFPFPFQFPPTPPLPPPPPPLPTVCSFCPCFPPVIVVEGAPPTTIAHHHHRSSWAVVGSIAAGVVIFLTIYNGFFTCKRNTRSMIKGIARWWKAKGKEGTNGRAARNTESNADAAESQQSVSSTPELKEEESRETEVSSTPESTEEESQETEEESQETEEVAL
ncbi:hypothetical protein CDL15_Pgr025937 [Punica granatum]|uniref:Uncharacterized protein n=2 Tax=Punica granatum TaxID=22663 RepID=A0A218WB37_PUNGR|nr:hypothetical protein CDL15_Pgr025937 [Punica granatum]